MVGLNCTLRVAVWLGFSVSGKLAPDTVNPAPVAIADVTVAADVPVDDSVIDCVAIELITTPPNEMLVAFTLSVPDPAGKSCSAKVALALPEVAVSVTVCEELTAVTVALNPTLVDPAGTVTLAGTVTVVLLLASWMLIPPVGAAAVSVAVHASVPALLMDAWLHEIAFSVGTAVPVPLRLTTRLPCAELLATVNWPVAAPAVTGLNCTFSVAV